MLRQQCQMKYGWPIESDSFFLSSLKGSSKRHDACEYGFCAIASENETLCRKHKRFIYDRIINMSCIDRAGVRGRGRVKARRQTECAQWSTAYKNALARWSVGNCNVIAHIQTKIEGAKSSRSSWKSTEWEMNWMHTKPREAHPCPLK